MRKTVIIAALAVLLGAGCAQPASAPRTPTPATQPPAAAYRFGQDIPLIAGQGIVFDDGLHVRLETINDSRCKPGVQCFWAGELGATFQVSMGDGAPQEVTLGQSTKPSASALGYAFTLVSATPESVTVNVAK